MENRLNLLVVALGALRVKRKIDISEYIESGLGGIAELFYLATTTNELAEAVNTAKELKIPFMLIGSGTKVALPATGFAGLVIKNRSSQLRVFGIKGKVSTAGIGISEALIEADAGVSIHRLSEFVLQQGLTGLSGLEHLPGTIGGNFFTNPQLQALSTQVTVLSGESSQAKIADELRSEDIILTVVFKFKAR